MKRTNSDSHSCGRHAGNPAATDQTAQDLSNSDQPGKSKGRNTSIRTPAEMKSGLRIALTSRSEQQNPAVTIKLGPVNCHNLLFPHEITIQIAQNLSTSRDRGNLALTCRPNYQAVDLADPMRRLPGLAGDLKRSCNRFSLRRETLQTFDEHLQRGGAYDQALLTPISSGARFAASIAMMIWASKYSLKNDAPETNRLALARVKTKFTALKKEMNVHALNAHVRAAFYAIINMEHSKDIGRVFNRFPASAITPFLNSDFLDDETHLSILTLLLRTPNKLREFSIYASNFMTDLPLEDVIRTTMGRSADPVILHKNFAAINPEKLKDELIKFIEISVQILHYNLHGQESYIVYCLCAVFSSFERLPESAHVPVMASLSILVESMVKLKPLNCRNRWHVDLAEIGHSWFSRKNSKDWNGFRSTYGNQIDSISRAYLLGLLQLELSYSPDIPQADRMGSLLKNCLSMLPGAGTFDKYHSPLHMSPELLEALARRPRILPQPFAPI